MTKYVHSELIQLYGQHTMVSDKPWEGWWQYRLRTEGTPHGAPSMWLECTAPIDFSWECLYVPPQRFTNHLGLKIPRGYDKYLPPEDGQRVLVPSLTSTEGSERTHYHHYHHDYPDAQIGVMLTLGLVYPDTQHSVAVLKALRCHLLGLPINTMLQRELELAYQGNVLLTNETMDTIKHRLMILDTIYGSVRIQ